MPSKATEPNSTKTRKMPSAKPKSPTRLTMKALTSQPKNIWTRLSAVTSISMAKVKSDR
jgi:hypothetical protein